MPTRELVGKLIMRNPDYWGAESRYGKPLTETRLGRLVTHAATAPLSHIPPAGRAAMTATASTPTSWRDTTNDTPEPARLKNSTHSACDSFLWRNGSTKPHRVAAAGNGFGLGVQV
jgi:hypothetical protein